MKRTFDHGQMRARCGAAGLLSCSIVLGVATGCAGPRLPPTPNLYLQGDTTLLEDVPLERQSVDVRLLYATDRAPTEDRSPTRRYSDGRSHALSVGTATVRFGEDLGWDALLRRSVEATGPAVPVELVEVEELVRFPSSLGLGADRPSSALAEAEDSVRRELSRRLSDSSRKDVFVYVHGVRNRFDDPMYRMAELWHYLGRPGVPVVYTWPARVSGDALVDYTYARESSEFTVYHLRQFLRVVASCPEVERIHILAHSRGTGITLTVLRDLRLLTHDASSSGGRALKLGNVILAAPDIDLEVANQLYHPDEVQRVADRVTVYLTPEDKALGLASWLFSGITRVGSTAVEDLSAEEIEALGAGRIGLDPIDVKVSKKGAHGHTYWIDNPAVLSDVILILRDDRPPGREHGRPLIRAESGLWEIYDGYPAAGVHAEVNEEEEAE